MLFIAFLKKRAVIIVKVQHFFALSHLVGEEINFSVERGFYALSFHFIARNNRYLYPSASINLRSDAFYDLRRTVV